MDEMEKRKLEEFVPDFNDSAAYARFHDLRSLLEPLSKPHLVVLLARLGSYCPSVAEQIRSIVSEDPAFRKLFLSGLAPDTTSETLCSAFEEHGEIEDCTVVCDKTTGDSRGYGFITYRDIESAHSALKAPRKTIDGRLVVCSPANRGLNGSSTSDQSQRKLFIGGLSPETTTEMLLDFFERYGEIEMGSVAYDKETNISRGFGFLTFVDAESAQNAIEDPNKILGGKKVTVKLADSNYKEKSHGSSSSSSDFPFQAQMGGGYMLPMGGYAYPQSMQVYTYPYYLYPSYSAGERDDIGGDSYQPGFGG